MVLIKSVRPLEQYRVLLEFNTGEQKTVDLDPLLRGPVFEPIRSSRTMFWAVRVDEELGTIVWPNGADMDPDVLYGSYTPAWMETERALAA
jgi:hypothetical protein